MQRNATWALENKVKRVHSTTCGVSIGWFAGLPHTPLIFCVKGLAYSKNRSRSGRCQQTCFVLYIVCKVYKA